MVKIGARGPLERRHLATLRIDARHDVLDGPVFAGGVHRLEDEQHRPAILRVKHVLQFRQRFDAALQRFFRPGFVLRFEILRVAGVHVFETKTFSIRNTVGPGEFAGSLDDLLVLGFRMAGSRWVWKTSQ